MADTLANAAADEQSQIAGVVCACLQTFVKQIDRVVERVIHKAHKQLVVLEEDVEARHVRRQKPLTVVV